MMKIGEFALLTNIPVKTIRYYDDIGLLKPIYIDDSKYRYYGAKQLLELNRIIELKETGFTLGEIIKISNEEMNQEELQRMLRGKLLIAKKERQYADMKIANIEAHIRKITKKEHKKMILDIKQAPYNFTLMGVIKGVSDFYNMELSQEMIYGITGQAFMINIHDELCPSGPYCFNRNEFYSLVKNMGIEMIDHGFYSMESSQHDRESIENLIKEHLRSNNPCGLLNLEYQIIYGFDETGLLTSQPWSDKFPPAHLSFKTWSELEDEVHMNIFVFNKTSAISLKQQIIGGLRYAIDINVNHDKYRISPAYSTGLKGYDLFIKMIDSDQGTRWNAMVWGECRKQAAKFFNELANLYPTCKDLANDLANDYGIIGEGLLKVSDTKVPIEPRKKLLTELKNMESKALDKIGILINKL